MKLNITDIIRLDGAYIDFDLDEDISGLTSVENGCIFSGPVKLKGRVTNVGGVMNLDANLTANYKATCYRCLKEIDCNMELVVLEAIFKSGAGGALEDTYFYLENELDFDSIVKDNILLNLPMRYLCKDDCKGICEVCGADKNITQCNCVKDSGDDSRFNALKDLFKND